MIDNYSRAAAGYFLSFEDPSALHTSLALRQAIWRKEDSRWIVCGIPDVLYTDNGSDFTSQHLEQVSADLKIRLVFSPGDGSSEPPPLGGLLFSFEIVKELSRGVETVPGYPAPFRRANFSIASLRETRKNKTKSLIA